MTVWKRVAALLIACAASVGVAIHFVALFHDNQSVSSTVWTLLAYFTITTNLLVAIVFGGIAAGVVSFARPWLVAGTCLSILLVGIVYSLLLHGLRELTGGSAIANALLHWTTPILVPLFWLIFVRKGTLNRRDPLLWAIYPLCYLLYALARGASSGRYAYPFLDVPEIGWSQTGVNVVLIACGYLIGGWLFFRLDHRLARANRSSST
jgi:hypothetical protein